MRPTIGRSLILTVLLGAGFIISCQAGTGNNQTETIARIQPVPPVLSMRDPRVTSVFVILGILSASAAFSSGVSAFMLRKRVTIQHEELQGKIAQLEKLEAEHNAMLSALPDLIFIYDTEGRFVDYMKSGTGGFAVEAEYFLGKTNEEIFGDRELHLRLLNAVKRALAGQGPQVFNYCLTIAPLEHYESRVVRLSADRALAINRDITERYWAEERVNASLLEKESLLKEIHHRVKNNMQIVSSLLSMQASRVRDSYDKELFVDSQNRIRTMAMVHDQLYRSKDFSSISARDYLSDLISGLEATWTRPDRWIRAWVDSDDTVLELDLAVPLGLIVNELVTNAYKYAFVPGSTGNISLVVRGDEETGQVVISVSDDGAGFPPGFDALQGEGGMGFTIINALIIQIKATLETGNSEDGGAFARITAKRMDHP